MNNKNLNKIDRCMKIKVINQISEKSFLKERLKERGKKMKKKQI